MEKDVDLLLIFCVSFCGEEDSGPFTGPPFQHFYRPHIEYAAA